MTDIPAVCDGCLGSDNVEMKRQFNGAECKICTLPFTIFKWKSNSTLHKTVICKNCSRSKNCCQSCLNDLTFGIDFHTRDKLFKLAKIDNSSKLFNKTSKIYHSNISNENPKNIDLSLIESKIQIFANSKVSDFNSKVKKLPFNGNLSENKSFQIFFLFGFKNLDNSTIANHFKIPTSSVHLNSTAHFAFIEFPDNSTATKIAANLGNPIKPALIIINNSPLRISWASKIITFSSEESIKLAKIVSRQMTKLSKDELRSKKLTSSKIHK